jgi:hypothetical protein
MNLSRLDDILWAASFMGHVALLCVLILRGRWRTFPIFTALIAFDTFLTVSLYGIYAHGSKIWYARIYWAAAVVDFALQIGVVLEVARIVLRPTGAWVRDARKQFVIWALMGVALAVLLAWGVSPPGLKAKEAWEVRGSLFTSLVTCELVLVMALTATRLGLGWRSHVMALGQGLAVWSIVAVAVDGIQSYLGAAQQFATLDHVRIFVYCASLLYWIVQFWLPEPVRRPISPEMRNYILALHRKVTYDLDSVDLES